MAESVLPIVGIVHVVVVGVWVVTPPCVGFVPLRF
jgi:hypothetical protein